MKTKKCIGLLTVAILFLLSSRLFSQKLCTLDKLDKFIKVERLSNRVLLIKTGIFYFDAITAIATKKGIVVIDAGSSPSLTKKYRIIIEKEFGRNDFAYVIYTHSHWDHTNGSMAFPEAVIVGHDSCQAELISDFSDKEAKLAFLNNMLQRINESSRSADKNSELGQQLDYRASLIATVLADLQQKYSINYPAMTFSDSLMIDMGDVIFQLKYFGKAHSESDIIIYIPEEKLLMSGDLFNAGGSGNLSQLNNGNVKRDDVKRWLKNINFLLGPNIEFTRIIDGHAAMLKKSDLDAFGKKVEFLGNEFNAGRELSARVKLEAVYKKSGLEAMKLEYNKMMTADKNKYFFEENTLIEFGYHLMQDKEFDGAIKVFGIVTEKFPNSSNAFDSLGEAYMKASKKRLAIENYEKSLKLDPQNTNAIEQLRKLRDK